MDSVESNSKQATLRGVREHGTQYEAPEIFATFGFRTRKLIRVESYDVLNTNFLSTLSTDAKRPSKLPSIHRLIQVAVMDKETRPHSSAAA